MNPTSISVKEAFKHPFHKQHLIRIPCSHPASSSVRMALHSSVWEIHSKNS